MKTGEGRRNSVSRVGLAALLACVTGAGAVSAETARLEGAWSGSGAVSLASGQNEKTRCRVYYAKKSKTAYSMRGSCATSSGKASQTATLRQVGPNRYEGSFFNPDFNVSGSISVVMRGASHLVSISTPAGGASLKMTR